MVELADLCRTLMAESQVLEAMLVPLDEGDSDTATPAPGWTVRHQITHLAFFDDATVQAVREPEAFARARAEALAGVDAYTERVARTYGSLPAARVLDWWRGSRERLVQVLAGSAAGVRVPWYGPTMSVASAVTARIMETWAHGQDVADGLGVGRSPTPALREVAHLGVRTLPNSFRAHGRPVPDEPVRVELDGGEGGRWSWGPVEAENVVRGPALDFCLVVTQRRHLADTSIVTTGPVAAEWMTIAQAFAGPPGRGRAPSSRRG